MKQTIETQRNPSLRGRYPVLIAGWLILFLGFTLFSTQAASAPETATWRGTGGTVLLQHTGNDSSLGLQAFKDNATTEQWTQIPENAGEWSAVAMDENQVLFFHKASSEMALCTLDETGAPTHWLSLKDSFHNFVPVALEGNSILMQRGARGILKKIHFDETGQLLSEERLWENSQGWAVRGMDANRIILEHLSTQQVAIWAANPKAPLFRPYHSFTLSPGWSVRDVANNFVLIQEGTSGAVMLVELGDEYLARKYTELGSINDGWRAVAMAQ